MKLSAVLNSSTLSDNESKKELFEELIYCIDKEPGRNDEQSAKTKGAEHFRFSATTAALNFEKLGKRKQNVLKVTA